MTVRAAIATTVHVVTDPPRDGRDGADGDVRRAATADRAANRPHFEAPPEVPQRPKPKRLRPGKARRNAVLADIPEEQRPIAELASQGMAAVRTRVKEENAKLEAEGKPTMPEASVVKMAEDLLPKLRVAEWLDRAEAAQRQMDHLDLRDLRSVIIAGDDSIVARDETAVALNVELKASLVRRQAEELQLWIEDIDASLGVGRVIRALRLSSQPPKAGVMFPPELARRLGEAATQALQPDDTADRWIAVLEAAAFSPVRSLVNPTTAPDDRHRRPSSDHPASRPGPPADRGVARRRDSRGRAPAQAAAPHGPPGREAQGGQRRSRRRSPLPRRPRPKASHQHRCLRSPRTSRRRGASRRRGPAVAEVAPSRRRGTSRRRGAARRPGTSRREEPAVAEDQPPSEPAVAEEPATQDAGEATAEGSSTDD